MQRSCDVAIIGAGVSLRSAYKWQPAGVTAAIERLRRQRLTGPQIARQLGGRARPSAWCCAASASAASPLSSPGRPVIRYQRAMPGELLHIDTKKLGKIDGIGHRITGDRTGPRRRSG